MNKIEDGGPAFPITKPSSDWGMTLRDYFATRAMQSYLTLESTASDPAAVIANAAYHMADAMLKARNA